MTGKLQLIEELAQKISDSMQKAEEKRREAQDESNRHIGRMESRYDTFKEEAQYLADNYTHQIAVLRKGLAEIGKLSGEAAANSDEIQLGSLFTLRTADGEKGYLLAPIGGGINLSGGYTTLTPESDLGKTVLGKKKGDSFSLPGRDLAKVFTVTEIA
jgi:transcription elongation GreA/GreB family factor